MLETKANNIADVVGTIPWTMILEFIMQMIEMCFPTAESLVEAKELPPLRKAALGVWIRLNFGVRGRSRVNEIREAILSEIAATADEDLVTVWREAKNALTPVDFPV